MTRNLRTLGLAFVSVFVMSAVVATGAHATEFFHSHKEKTIFTGANEGTGHTEPHKFEISGVAMECGTTKLEGTEVGVGHIGPVRGQTYTTETLTLTPTTAECTFAGHPATVNTVAGECHIKLFAATTETTAGKTDGNLEIICATGKTIDISVESLGITIHIPPQLIPHVVHYANVNTTTETEREELTITTTAEHKIAWTCTPKASCTAAFGASSGTEASYTGLTTMKGFVDNNEPKDAGVTGIYKEGLQTGIWKGPEE